MVPTGGSERGKAGERRTCLRARLRRVQRPEAVFELVGGEAAVGHVLAEDLRDQMSIGVTDAEAARVGLGRIAHGCGRRRGQGQTQRRLASRAALGDRFALLRFFLLDKCAAVKLDLRPVRRVVAHRDAVSHARRRQRVAERATRDLRGHAVLEGDPQPVPAGARFPAFRRRRPLRSRECRSEQREPRLARATVPCGHRDRGSSSDRLRLIVLFRGDDILYVGIALVSTLLMRSVRAPSAWSRRSSSLNRIARCYSAITCLMTLW